MSSVSETPRDVTPLMAFISDSLLCGGLSLAGFASNTVAFIILVQHRRLRRFEGRPVTGLDLLRMTLTFCNVVVLWSIFVMYVIPGFGLVVPLLSDCVKSCSAVVTVIRPVYLASRALAVWLSVASVFYLVSFSKNPGTATSKPHRVLTLVVLICAFWFVLMGVESWKTVADVGDDVTDYQTALKSSFRFHLICFDVFSALSILLPLVLVPVITCLKLPTSGSHRREVTPVQARRTPPANYHLCFLVLCYIPEIVFTWVVVVDQLVPQWMLGSWMFYLAAVARIGVSVNASLAMIFFVVTHEEYRLIARHTCCSGEDDTGGRSKGGYEAGDDVTGGMYRCDDVTKETLISEGDGEGGGSILYDISSSSRWSREDAAMVRAAAAERFAVMHRGTQEETVLTKADINCHV